MEWLFSEKVFHRGDGHHEKEGSGATGLRCQNARLITDRKPRSRGAEALYAALHLVGLSGRPTRAGGARRDCGPKPGRGQAALRGTWLATSPPRNPSGFRDRRAGGGMAESSAQFHESEERLTPRTRDLHRALVSLQEE